MTRDGNPSTITVIEQDAGRVIIGAHNSGVPTDAIAGENVEAE